MTAYDYPGEKRIGGTAPEKNAWREAAAAREREQAARRRERQWRRIAFASGGAALLFCICACVCVFLFAPSGGRKGTSEEGNGNAAAANTPETGKDGSAGGKVPGKEAPLICIDPGHGFTKSSGLLDVGCNTGAYFDATGKTEADFNLECAECLRKELERRGCRVVMVREKNEDRKLEIAERPDYINSLDPDLCISLHGNSFDGKVTGARVFVSELRPDCDAFADALVKAVNRARKSDPSLTDPAASMKKDSTGIVVLRDVRCPVALVESLFLDAEQDAAKAASPQWQARFASALADGILDYLPAVEQ